MGKGRSIILGIISFILITIIPIIIIGVAALPLLYPAAYLGAFEKAGVYEKAPQAIAGRDATLGQMFTEDFMRKNAEIMLSNGLAYVRGETDVLDLSIPIDRNQIRNILLQRMNLLPPCPAGTLPQSNENPECLPEGINRAQYVDAVLNQVQLPNKIDITAAQPQFKEGANKIRELVGAFYTALYGMLALAIILFLIVILLTRHSPKSMMKWIGTTLLMSGITVIALSLVLNSIVMAAVATQIGSSEIVNVLISAILGTLVSGMQAYSIAMAIIGIILAAVSWKMKSAEAKKKK